MIVGRVVIVIAAILIVYTASMGIVIAILRNDRLLEDTLKIFDLQQHKRREVEGAFIMFAPIGLIILILMYIGYFAYLMMNKSIKFIKGESKE